MNEERSSRKRNEIIFSLIGGLACLTGSYFFLFGGADVKRDRSSKEEAAKINSQLDLTTHETPQAPVVAHRGLDFDQSSKVGDLLIANSLPHIREPAQVSQAPLVSPTPTVVWLPVDFVKPSAESKKLGVRFALGLGEVYESVTENLSEYVAKYHKIISPAVRLEAGLKVSDRVDLEALYQNVRLHFDNSSVGDPDSAGSWKNVALNLTAGSRHGERDELRFKTGIAAEEMPLNFLSSTGTAPFIRDFTFINLGAGVSYHRLIDERTRLVAEGILKYPLSASAGGGDLTLRPQLFLDSDLGIDKRIFPSAWFGLHWTSTYRTFNFNYRDQTIVDGGTQNFFLSALELRLNFDF